MPSAGLILTPFDGPCPISVSSRFSASQDPSGPRSERTFRCQHGPRSIRACSFLPSPAISSLAKERFNTHRFVPTQFNEFYPQCSDSTFLQRSVAFFTRSTPDRMLFISAGIFVRHPTSQNGTSGPKGWNHNFGCAESTRNERLNSIELRICR